MDASNKHAYMNREELGRLARRKAGDRTQTEIAEDTGIAQSGVSYALRGKEPGNAKRIIAHYSSLEQEDVQEVFRVPLESVEIEGDTRNKKIKRDAKEGRVDSAPARLPAREAPRKENLLTPEAKLEAAKEAMEEASSYPSQLQRELRILMEDSFPAER